MILFFLPIAFCLGQNISFEPAIDTIWIVSTCTPPAIQCSILKSPNGIDTIIISPSWGTQMWKCTPNDYWLNQIPKCYFIVRDSAKNQDYRLWVYSHYPQPPPPMKIPFDTSVYQYPGPSTISLLVTRENITIDSSNHFFIFDALGSVEDFQKESLTPQSCTLLQNYPNPFNGQTHIAYNLEHSGHTLLRVFNMKGQLLETILDRHMEAGTHFISWHPKNISSGSYFISLSQGYSMSVIVTNYLK
jgi:hypothetical protein